MRKRLKVVVVGGSIGGLTTAVLLTRQGHEVTVFERSKDVLRDRGAGIGLPQAFVDQLQDRDLVDPGMQGVSTSRRLWTTKRDGVDGVGAILGEQPMFVHIQHWGLVYRQVQRRAADVDLRRDAEVAGLRTAADGRPEIILHDGSRVSADLVVGADGYRSRIRATIFPDSDLHYAGYPIWRGLVPESEVTDLAPVEDVFFSAGTIAGHTAFFLIPGTNGEVEPGLRRLNWVWYDALVPAELLGATKRDGVLDVRSVNPGETMPSHVRTHLHDAAVAQLPPWQRDIVLATPHPYVQPVFDLELPTYVSGSVCLLGDAASVARQHTANGTAKAMQDALTLDAALRVADELPDALAAYDAERAPAGAQLVGLGRALGEQQVTGVPDWESLDDAGFADWLHSGASGHHYAFRSPQPSPDTN